MAAAGEGASGVGALQGGAAVAVGGAGSSASEGAVSSSGAAERPMKRVQSVIRVRPEKLERYRQLHAEPWPGVLQRLAQSNITNYSISLLEVSPGEHLLFSYFEYRGSDWEGDMAAIAADPTTQQWWEETDPCQQRIKGGPSTPASQQSDKSQWVEAEEVFYMA